MTMQLHGQELEEEEFMKFKFFLKDPALKLQIPQGDLDDASCRNIVKLIVQRYTNRALVMARKMLEQIPYLELVERFQLPQDTVATSSLKQAPGRGYQFCHKKKKFKPPTAPIKMNKIIIYEHANFQSCCKEITSDICNLTYFNWNDCVSSVKVFGQTCVAYEHENFRGQLVVFEEGQYAYAGNVMNDRITSLQLITEDLSNPQITLYEHVDYQGCSRVVREPTNFARECFNDQVSSHKVQRGAWLLCEHCDGSGFRYIALAHENLPHYGVMCFNDKLIFIRPLYPGGHCY